MKHLLLSVAFLVGCKGKPTEATPPAVGSALPSVGSGSAEVGSGSVNPKTEMILPNATNTAPVKSTAKIDEAKAKALAAIQHPTWLGVDKMANNDGLDMRHTSTSRPFVQVAVEIRPCFDCLPMELDKWKAKEEALMQLFPKALRSQPGSVFESGTIDMGGQPMVWTYQLGQVSRIDDADNPQNLYSNAYALYFNDGINQIRVVSQYKDQPLKDVAALGKAVSKDLLEQAARSFMDFYVHAW